MGRICLGDDANPQTDEGRHSTGVFLVRLIDGHNIGDKVDVTAFCLCRRAHTRKAGAGGHWEAGREGVGPRESRRLLDRGLHCCEVCAGVLHLSYSVAATCHTVGQVRARSKQVILLKLCGAGFDVDLRHALNIVKVPLAECLLT